MCICVGSGVYLYLIKFFGFKIDDIKFRCSVVDYYDVLNFEIYEDFESFKNEYLGIYFYLLRYGRKIYSVLNY